MKPSTLDNTEFEYIVNSLQQNNGMSDVEYLLLKEKHPYAVMRDDNALILSSMKHYGKHDTNFNDFLLNKFGQSDYSIDFFYELIYGINDYTNPHRDSRIVVQTTLIMLDDNFTGGELLINGNDVGFNKKGMYINFNGHKDVHSVNRVESGERRVLVLMFNKTKNTL